MYLLKIDDYLEILTILDLDYQKENDCKIFHSSNKLIASDLDIDEAVKSMHQRIITKVKNYVCEDYVYVYVCLGCNYKALY